MPSIPLRISFLKVFPVPGSSFFFRGTSIDQRTLENVSTTFGGLVGASTSFFKESSLTIFYNLYYIHKL